jgi:hypothetical protein
LPKIAGLWPMIAIEKSTSDRMTQDRFMAGGGLSMLKLEILEKCSTD